MGGVVIVAVWVVGGFAVVRVGLPALVWALRPLLIRVAPPDMCGPEGWVIDTVNRSGMLDFGGGIRGAVGRG
ncbi:hypothetical protein [Thalassovita sp.]|uniref:hypothetical protein n=1 Tax=Thalassovita sp. TaxID=1979401 RepID=UPI0029DE6064|nr:hypothetical protein [Thalassovita sp.]